MLLAIGQGQERTIINWKQTYFTDFLSEIGGLFTSLMGGAMGIISGH